MSGAQDLTARLRDSVIVECGEAADRIDALARDAARYRWLRRSGRIAAHLRSDICMPLYPINDLDRFKLDAAIDAAISKESEHD